MDVLSLLAALILLSTAALAEVGNYHGDYERSLGLVEVISDKSFHETVDLLNATLQNNTNIRVIAEIDHSQAAKDAGLDLLPNLVIFFGNPALGTPIMQQNIFAGLDLPQKMLIWEDVKKVTRLAYNPPKYIEKRYKGTSNASTLETIAIALKNIASTATCVDVEDFQVPKEKDFFSIYRYRGVYNVMSKDDFNTTWNRLLQAIDEPGGPDRAVVVDHGSNSGGTLGNSRLVVFGNPILGTPLMKANPRAGIDLPLKILVTENDDGNVTVSTNKIGFLERRHELKGIERELEAVRNAIMNFVNIAAGDP